MQTQQSPSKHNAPTASNVHNIELQGQVTFSSAGEQQALVEYCLHLTSQQLLKGEFLRNETNMYSLTEAFSCQIQLHSYCLLDGVPQPANGNKVITIKN
jgi:hypothetical protein